MIKIIKQRKAANLYIVCFTPQVFSLLMRIIIIIIIIISSSSSSSSILISMLIYKFHDFILGYY